MSLGSVVAPQVQTNRCSRLLRAPTVLRESKLALERLGRKGRKLALEPLASVPARHAVLVYMLHSN